MSTETDRVRHEPVAVIGAGCRFPGGVDSVESLWQLLAEGRDAAGKLPEDRWSLEELTDAAPDVMERMRWGCYLEGDIGAFDPGPFGMNDDEAAWVDPQHRLFLEVAWEAFEHAGIPMASLSGSRTGVFAGVYTDDYLLRNRPAPEDVGPYYGLTAMHSTMVGRVAFLWNLQGPSMAVDTACSSSLVATHLACQSLRAGESDLALAGGVQLVQTPEQMLTQAMWGMLSPTGHCRSFDAEGDGFTRGEGCGVLVLKRLADAERDGDRVLAVLRGSAVNQDGRSIRLTAPSAAAQEKVFRAALEQAGVDAADVGMVEGHGPGTPVGDPIEFESTAAVFGDGRGRCALGSIKSNIGHAEPASGVAGLLKAILSVNHGAIPPSLHFTRWNEQMATEGTRLFVPTEMTAWPVQGGARLAAVSGYGVGGTNAQVIVGEPPAVAATGEPADGEGRMRTFMLSAGSAPALVSESARLADWLEGHDGSVVLDDVAHTLAERRDHDGHRMAVVAGCEKELVGGLRAFAEGRDVAEVVADKCVPETAVQSVWVFSGQGSQWTRMGHGLLDRDAAFTESIAHLEPLIKAESGLVLREVLAAPEVVTGFARVQPVLYALQISLAAMWRAHGVEPGAVIGHSVGEVAAAVVAGALSVEDGAKIVCRRSRLLSRAAGGGAMASVQLSAADVEAELAAEGTTGVTIAVLASPSATVVAGDHDQVESLVRKWEQAGVTVARVAVDVASHSPHVDVVLNDIRSELAGLQPREPTVDFYSTVGEDPRELPVFDAAYWADNLRRPVQFANAAAAAIDDGHRLFVEVSPHPLLGSALRQTVESATSATVQVLPTLLRDTDELRCFTEQLARLHCAGGRVDWSRLYGTGRLTDVPATTWDRRHYLLTPSRVQRGDGASADGHPLLGYHVHDLDGDDRHWWQATVGVERLPWLADHRVEEVPVLPGAGMCEAALAAACSLYGTGPERVLVHDVELRALLPLTAPAQVTQTVTPQPAGPAAWALTSRDDSGTRTTHATASLELVDEAQTGTRPPGVDLPRCLQEHPKELDVAAFYTSVAGAGIPYGPAFTALESVRLAAEGGGSALAEIELPREARAGTSKTYWHPVLFDACLQAMLALWLSSGRRGDGLVLPTSVGSVRVHGSTAPGRYCLARMENADADGCTGDVQWLDEDGTVLAEATGVRFARADTRADKALFDNCLLQVRWPAAPLASELPRADGDWLLITESDDDAAARDLADGLRTRGGTCHTVTCPTGLTPDATAAAFERALAARPDWRDIVVLPGARRTTPDEETLDEAERRVRRLALLAKSLTATDRDTPPRLWVLTPGARHVQDGDDLDLGHSGLRGLVRVLGYEHSELRATSVDTDPATRVADLVGEFLAGEASDDEIAWRDGRRYRARLTKAPMREDERRTDTRHYGEDGFALSLRHPGDLGSTEFVPRQRETPAADEIEIRVEASGLNFIDVLVAMGVYPSEDPALGKPLLTAAPTMEQAGMECAGVITSVGDAVTEYREGDRVILPTLGRRGGFASFVTASAAWAVPLPSGMATETAAALPTAYITAWYALIHLARVRSGESVLIHSATGGVGLAALNIARSRGTRILATAGTAAKRDHLRSLGIEHVFDSRTLDFADQTRRATDGRGVDVVLNSLTGPAQKAGLDLLAPQGRFIEIGKKDIYANTGLGQYPFRKNIAFHSVDLAALCRFDPELITQITQDVVAEIAEGTLPPLPCTTFPVSDAATAFRTLANAEHIGKIVLSWPDQGEATVITPPETVPIARADGGYIITGGLGGLGLLFAQRLAELGAGHIVLNSRHEPDPDRQRILDTISRGGTRVTVVTGDLADEHTANRLVTAATSDGHRLRGVLHGAAVVEDITIGKFDPDLLHRVWRPKAIGAWRLHEATQEHEPDWWAGFSSVVSVFGSPGQSPYAAASAWLDEFLSWRTAQGHTDTRGINWGIWSTIGRGVAISERYASIEPADGLAAFEKIVRYGRTRTGYNPFDLTDWLASFATLADVSFFSDVVTGEKETTPEQTTPLAELRAATDPDERRAILCTLVTGQLAAVLRRDTDLIGADSSLASLGLDSLMGLELRNRLERDLDTPIPRIVIWTSPTVTVLVDSILTHLGEHLTG